MGIYGMWNLYVFVLMFLYVLFYKNYGEDQFNGDLGVYSGEEFQFIIIIIYVDGFIEIYKLICKEVQEQEVVVFGWDGFFIFQFF